MFQITYEDSTFNDWEQALMALLQYEFKCPVQAEWQLFGTESEGVLERPSWTGDGTDDEKSVLQKIASIQKASLGVFERAKLTARQEQTFEDPDIQASEWDRVNSRLYTILMTYTKGALNQTIMTAKRQNISAGEQYAQMKTAFEESSSMYRTSMISQIT